MSTGYRRNGPRKSLNAGGIPEGSTPVLSLSTLKFSDRDNHRIRSGQFVYFMEEIEEDGSCRFVKIGSSRSIWSRLSSLQIGSTGTLRIASVIDCPESIYLKASGVERAVHDLVRSARYRGEWYHRSHPGVSHFIERADELPWRVYERMLRVGVREWIHQHNPKALDNSKREERVIKSVKALFSA